LLTRRIAGRVPCGIICRWVWEWVRRDRLRVLLLVAGTVRCTITPLMNLMLTGNRAPRNAVIVSGSAFVVSGARMGERKDASFACWSQMIWAVDCLARTLVATPVAKVAPQFSMTWVG